MNDATKSSLARCFREYTEYSVQLDCYFNMVCIYGMHHHSLKSAYAYTKAQQAARRETIELHDDDFGRSALAISNILRTVATTGIWEDELYADSIQLDEYSVPALAYSTCYCQQWTLFEVFVQDAINSAIERKVVLCEIPKKLKKFRNMQKLLELLESGKLLGVSPFRTVLPVPGWTFQVEECGFEDLNDIRNRRNSLIHSPTHQNYSALEITELQRIYERDMWILRKYAENLYQDILRLPG